MRIVLPTADFFQNQNFHYFFFKVIISVSNSLDTDLAQHLVGPDPDPSCLQRLSAVDIIR